MGRWPLVILRSLHLRTSYTQQLLNPELGRSQSLKVSCAVGREAITMGRLTVKRRELPRFRVVMIEIRSLLRAWRSATGSYGADRTMKGEFEFAKTSQAPPPPTSHLFLLRRAAVQKPGPIIAYPVFAGSSSACWQHTHTLSRSSSKTIATVNTASTTSTTTTTTTTMTTTKPALLLNSVRSC